MGEIRPPRGEQIWTAGYDTDGHLIYILTTKKDTHGPFYIYKVDGASYRKLGSGKSPLLLEDKYIYHQGGDKK